MKKLAWLPLMLAALSCANRTYQVNGIYSAPDGTDGTILARGLRGEDIYTAVESVLASR